MNAFIKPLEELKDYRDMMLAIEQDHLPIYIEGCIDPQKSHLVYSLAQQKKIKLIITHNDLKAKEIYETQRFFDKNTYLYPAKDAIFFSVDIRGNYIVAKRLEVIRALLEGQPMTIVTTIDGLLDKILPLEMIQKNVITLEEAQVLDFTQLIKQLSAIGFIRVGQVEAPGQFAVRGGILDIYNISDECPYRIEMWDDEIDSIRSFDVESQRSIERIELLKIYPASEFVLNQELIENGLEKIKAEQKEYEQALLKEKQFEAVNQVKSVFGDFEERLKYSWSEANIDGFVEYFYDQTVSFIDYLDALDSLVFIDEPARIEEKLKTVRLEFDESMTGRLEKGYILPNQLNLLYSKGDIFHKIATKKVILMSVLYQKLKSFQPKTTYHLTVKSINPYNSNFDILTKELKKLKADKYRVIMVSSSRSKAKRLALDLQAYGVNAFYSEDLKRQVNASEIMIVYGKLNKGMEYPLIKFSIITEDEIFSEHKKKKRKKKSYSGEKINDFLELNIGDYVVHENHGLGIYRGIEKVEVDGTIKDYIKIEYQSGGNLYILATQLDLIQKYASSDSRKPKLNKLGGQEWKKTKTRVKKAVAALAQDLIELYAIRQQQQGYVYGQDTIWQTEFEEMFPYTETDDQLLAIEAAKKDMESTKIMDRLVCGDVGYGKTEVAIRTAFKAVQEGKQVVLLVPTTILAQQHYNTFVQRMKDYPVKIDLLCRFRTKAQQSETLKELKKGFVDILIGTHRVLSKDVEFKDLGLLVVDEEQRFGVTHKEKIKKLKENIDVLTLTATPIPRTLHMSLIGIRDMSVLEEPPRDRMPIQTYVMEHNEEMVKEAINRELARDGQVYYVYNRVTDIDEIAHNISQLVPDAEVAFAHGQMKERELEDIMYRFIDGEIDVLVSTTIIETGLDISNVNTMIIHDADRLGLSQLYQLRGRVGRGHRLAYTFLMYKRNSILKEVAEKRLSAIREFTELGSGFKIAMRDLEIRGAGSLLGEQQSGHMEAVGYDLYCKMLNESVKSLKGEAIEENFETTIDLEIDAYIPATYIKNEFQKFEIYKRIAAISNEEEYNDMADELMDRYGELPKAAQNLLAVALLKAMAHQAGIVELSHKNGMTKVTMHNRAKVDINKIPELLNKHKQNLKFVPEECPYFIFNTKGVAKKDLIKCEKLVIKEIASLHLENSDEQ